MNTTMHLNLTVQQRPTGWTCEYPSERSSLPLEQVDVVWGTELMKSNWKWSLYAGAIYVVTIFALQRWMKNRPAMNLKTTLFWWNSGIGLFSIMAFVRTAPRLLATLGKSNGFYTSICLRNWGDATLEFWSALFVLSKFVELFDTLFIVLRKRRLVLVQWYHHLATMNAVWMFAPMMEPVQIWYMVLNYGVHSLLYPYFALMTIGVKVPKGFANVITTLQFCQMIIGIAVNVLSAMYFYENGQDCYRTDSSIKGFTVLYTSFIVLFGKLFYDAVIKSGTIKGNGSKVKTS